MVADHQVTFGIANAKVPADDGSARGVLGFVEFLARSRVYSTVCSSTMAFLCIDCTEAFDGQRAEHAPGGQGDSAGVHKGLA